MHIPGICMQGEGVVVLEHLSWLRSVSFPNSHRLQLRGLCIAQCEQLRVVDLSGLGQLEQLRIAECSRLQEVKGLSDLGRLDLLELSGCLPRVVSHVIITPLLPVVQLLNKSCEMTEQQCQS